MSFLCMVAGLSLRNRMRSLEIQERLRVEPLLLQVERKQLRWFGHLVRKLPVSLGRFRACPSRRRAGEDGGRAGEIVYLGWLGNISVSLLRSWWKWLGRGVSGFPCSGDPVKQQKRKRK